MNKLVITCCTSRLNNLKQVLSISNYKYNHDWFTGWRACGSRWDCGKERIPEEERPAEKNEGDVDLRSVRISEGRRSEEGLDIKGRRKRGRRESEREYEKQ